VGALLERNSNVSLTVLDEQHLRLYRFVEELDCQIAAGVGEAAMGSILLALEEYTKIHFGDEEDLMRIHGYHSLRAHRAEHNGLAMRLVVAREEHEAGKRDVVVSLAQYLHSWLNHHIQKWDREFHRFLTAKGLQ
jgi:hemerythrin